MGGRMERVPFTDKYKTMQESSKEKREKSDCAVVALSVALNVQYQTVWNTLRHLGRKHRRMTKQVLTMKAIGILGGKVTHTYTLIVDKDVEDASVFNDPRRDDHRYVLANKWMTPNNLIKDRIIDPKKRYLVRTRRHIFAIVDGKVHDWQIGRKFKVRELMEVTAV